MRSIIVALGARYKITDRAVFRPYDWESARLLAEAQSEQSRIGRVRRPLGLQALLGRASKESHAAYDYRFLHPVVEDATCRDGRIEPNPKGKIGPITPLGPGAGRGKVLETLDAQK